MYQAWSPRVNVSAQLVLTFQIILFLQKQAMGQSGEQAGLSKQNSTRTLQKLLCM